MKQVLLLITSVLFFATSYAAPATGAAPSVPVVSAVPVVTHAAPAIMSNDATATSKSLVATPENGTLTVDHPVYRLQLNSNPTTGYSWFIAAYPTDLLTVTKHEYTPPEGNRIGASGSEVWEFTAKPEAFAAPMVLKIEMVYARPWEINDQTTKQNFYIVTR